MRIVIFDPDMAETFRVRNFYNFLAADAAWRIIMKLLVCNVGSTSLKFKLYEMPEERVYCRAGVERVGSADSAIFTYKNEESGCSVRLEGQSVPEYRSGISMFLKTALEDAALPLNDINEIEAVGFKTVLSKGYYGVHELDENVIQGMRDFLYIAPVHNSAYLSAVGQFRELLPHTPLIGVFETAFHTTIPPERSIYPVPYEWYEKYGIKKLAYHGASHEYISEQSAKYGENRRVISCHLGGSCSVCAILDGESVDSSFGFSLQTGVFHANRCGDIDPYIIPFLLNEGMSIDEVLDGLSKNGGLLGISGVSNDLRLVMQAADSGNARAKLAVDAFVCSIVRFIGMFYAELGGLDQLVFTGGIGEHSAEIRSRVCSAVSHMGVVIDESRNSKVETGVITRADSPVKAVVIPANEELGIARKSYRYISEKGMCK